MASIVMGIYMKSSNRWADSGGLFYGEETIQGRRKYTCNVITKPDLELGIVVQYEI